MFIFSIKKKYIVFLIGILMITVVGGVFGQAINRGAEATSVTTYVLSDFDDHTKTENVNVYNGGKHDVVWNLKSSVFTTMTDDKQYPQKAFIPGVPALLSAEYKREAESMRLFAVRTAYNVKGVNTLDMIPTDNKNDVYVDDEGNPLPGIYFPEPVYKIGLYALGIFRNYDVTATFETEDGKVFSVILGNLNYKGWKILSADIPISKYTNEETFINNRYLIKLTKISIRTKPGVRVDDFVVYFDQFFYTKAAVNEKYYDGYEILLPDYKFNANGTSNIEWKEGSDGKDTATTTQ